MSNNKSNKTGAQTSDRKVEANRKNATKSPGPTTVSGKAISSKNAIKHGLFSKAVILPGENETEYEALANQIWSELGPRNVLEELLVKEIIDTKWRLGRLLKVEATVFTRRSISFTGHDCGSGFAFVNDAQGLDAFAKLNRYEATLSRRFLKCLRDLRKLREEGWPTNDEDCVYTGREDQDELHQLNNNGEENPDTSSATTNAAASEENCAAHANHEQCVEKDIAPQGLKSTLNAPSHKSETVRTQTINGPAEPGGLARSSENAPALTKEI